MGNLNMKEEAQVSNDGLKVEMEIDSFYLSRYMDVDAQDHPVSWLCSLLFRARDPVWFDDRFVIAQSKSIPGSSLFIIYMKFTFSEKFGTYIFSNIKNRDLKANKIFFKDKLYWITEASYIGDKILEIQDTLCAADRTELGQVKILYGLADFQSRQLISLPEEMKLKASLIQHNMKPSQVEVKQPLPGDNVTTLKSVVGPSHIDSNKHANVSYYLSIAIQALRALDTVPDKTIRTLTLLCKKETVLGDELVTKAWNSSKSYGDYFCVTTKDDTLASFFHATYYSNPCAKL